MELTEFIKNFGEQLENGDDIHLDGNTNFKALDEWDSMNILAIIAMIDKKYNKQITTEDIEKSNTIEELFIRIKSM